jgi:hypothetical protein
LIIRHLCDQYVSKPKDRTRNRERCPAQISNETRRWWCRHSVRENEKKLTDWNHNSSWSFFTWLGVHSRGINNMMMNYQDKFEVFMNLCGDLHTSKRNHTPISFDD